MVTISSLRKALDTAKESFHTLSSIVWENTPIVRSTYFSESLIKLSGQPFLISIPLTNTALKYVETILPLKLFAESSIVPRLMLLRDEMYYKDAVGEHRTTDVLLEPICEGMTMDMALIEAKSDPAMSAILDAAINRLDEQLTLANVSHNNLKESNLILDSNNNLRPIRWHYATKGAGGDRAAIDALRTKIASLRCDDLLCDFGNGSYMVEACDLNTYRNSLAFSEGLIAIETDDGWGYINCEGDIVIQPQYHWVSQFCESRAEVETASGMGLIDKSGHYIIAPEYCIVDYNPVTGHSMVNNGSGWAEFDYSGNIITEFGKAELKV